MGMSSSDDEDQIMRDHVIRNKYRELRDVIRRRPNRHDNYRESEDEAACREYNERKKFDELADLIDREESEYWSRDRR